MSTAYTGKGSDLIYELMPSLKDMRMADSSYSEQPASSKFPGRWHAIVRFCSRKSIEEAKEALRADAVVKGFKELRDVAGNVFFSNSRPPRGYHYVSAKVLDEASLRGTQDVRKSGERSQIEVTVSYYP